jgi:rhodanese-related sulfurtransferase
MNKNRSVNLPLLTLLCLAVFPGAGLRADDIKSPENIPGTTKVDAEGVLQLVETIPELIIIDSRVALDRKQGYIQGSQSLPDAETTCASLAKHLRAKDAPVLFYCNGVKCGRSVKAALMAMQCGYNRVYWFRGGFEEWKQKNYPFLKE